MKICSQNDYQFITNFEWYISVLVELTRMEGKVVAKGERLVLVGCFLGRGVGLGGLWCGVGFKVVEY